MRLSDKATTERKGAQWSSSAFYLELFFWGGVGNRKLAHYEIKLTNLLTDVTWRHHVACLGPNLSKQMLSKPRANSANITAKSSIVVSRVSEAISMDILSGQLDPGAWTS